MVLFNRVIFLPSSQDETMARNLNSLALEDCIRETRISKSILQILDQPGLMQRGRFGSGWQFHCNVETEVHSTLKMQTEHIFFTLL